jgi:hypothetical protein
MHSSIIMYLEAQVYFPETQHCWYYNVLPVHTRAKFRNASYVTTVRLQPSFWIKWRYSGICHRLYRHLDTNDLKKSATSLCRVHFSTLKMHTVWSSKMSVAIKETTRRHITAELKHNVVYDNLISVLLKVENTEPWSSRGYLGKDGQEALQLPRGVEKTGKQVAL